MQLLHHATVLQLEYGLFVVSFRGHIRCCVLVHFPRHSRKVFERLLTRYVETHLGALFGREEWPELNEKHLSQGKYTVEADTAQFLFKLQETVRLEAVSNNCPIPKLVQFMPRCVAYWNATKGGIDVISRYLRHLHVEYHNVSPEFSVQLRLLHLCCINALYTE